MAIVDVITTKPNNAPAVLTTKCATVEIFDDSVKELAQNLLDTAALPENKAAGLAAPQIGVSKRICVVKDIEYNFEDPKKEKVTDYILINPKVIAESSRETINWEGCVSIPNYFGLVKRAKKIKIEAYSIEGKKFKLSAKGDFARVILHEIDHLNGVLFTSKVVGDLLTEKQLDDLLSKKYTM